MTKNRIRWCVPVLVGVALLGPTACGNPNHDNEMCDFYQSLGAGYTQNQGYIPADVQASIHKYCD